MDGVKKSKDSGHDFNDEDMYLKNVDILARTSEIIFKT